LEWHDLCVVGWLLTVVLVWILDVCPHQRYCANRRYLQLLKDRFNSGVKYKRKTRKWDTVILNKTQEMARFLLDKSKQIDFVEPHPDLQRSDTQELRKRILELTQAEAQRLGIGKSTLHYLRKHARNERSVMIYEKVRSKLLSESYPSPAHLVRVKNR